jgi:(p)ppGpp synthase/HD superfamily hydrolase
MEINDAETHARLWTKKLIKAIAFAVKHHGSQTRKFSGEPYVLHPIRVAQLLLHYYPKCSTEMLYAALFHDLLEDSKTVKEDEIASEFGIVTLKLVKELTNDKEEIVRAGKTVYLCDKITIISDEALTVKLCDRLDNISDIKSEDKWSADYAKQTYEILRKIVESGRMVDLAQQHLFFHITYTLKEAGYPEPSFLARERDKN